MKKITAVVIGYGDRGARYAEYSCKHPEEFEIVAVAEPLENRRQTAQERHSLSASNIFD